MNVPDNVWIDAEDLAALRARVAKLEAERDEWKDSFDRVWSDKDDLLAERDMLLEDATLLADYYEYSYPTGDEIVEEGVNMTEWMAQRDEAVKRIRAAALGKGRDNES